jgi:hypothetical protein
MHVARARFATSHIDRTAMNANNRFDATCEAVMQLDLSAIRTKLMHGPSGEGWSPQKTEAIEREYRRFLCLMATYPDESISPTVDVDTFWHYHILDTMKYAADCQQAFGCFMHHYPYVGLGGEDDQQVRLDSGERMRVLYEMAFGEAMACCFDDEPAVTGTAAGAWCAGPAAHTPPLAAGASAWCAAPAARLRFQAAGGLAAWCAGPGAKETSRAARNTGAWCAGPAATETADAAGNAGAWRAGPAVRHTAGGA